MIYEPNPKHKPLPTPGRRGSICPPNADGPALLPNSVLHGKKRYATDGLQAFCAQQHDVARDAWHGYPVAWNEVPPTIIRAWVTQDPALSRVVRRSSRQRT